MLWYDTSNGVIKQRNAADSAWVTVWGVGKQGLIPQDGSSVYAADAGSSDAYAITLSPAPSSLTTGQVVNFKANTSNTGAATLNVNAIGATTIKKNGNTDLATGDIVANQLVSVIYDGTNFQMISPVAATASTTGLPANYLKGGLPRYNTAAQIIIPDGTTARNSTDSYDITLGADITIDITTSGAAGLDTGSEASNTWYYVYLIGDSSAVNNPSALLSVTNEADTGSITLPSGYDIKRQYPLAVRNDGSSNFLRFYCPELGYVRYQAQTSNYNGSTNQTGTNNVLSAGSATSYTNVDFSSFTPPISRWQEMNAFVTGQSGFLVREDGYTGDDIQIFGDGGATFTVREWIRTSTSQVIEYMRDFGTHTLYLDSVGYRVTELVY